MQSRTLRGPLRRALRGAVVIAVLTTAMLFGFPDQTRHFMQMLSGQADPPDPVTVYPYNFTSQGIDYLVSPGLIGYLPPGAATGKRVLRQGYVPAPSDKGRLPVRWRYVMNANAPHGGGAYDYGATLDLPTPQSKAAVLTLRFYPDGKIAARYTTHPEVAADGNVDPALTGPDWKTNKPGVGAAPGQLR
ncbi:hypothetical protein [Bordetella sp. FB-8]|uniref:hypothetical protein n=1 Tax=Bordetella sp. FB-8 TaxID=1159870 RepID=UPI000381A151|nr:hypothetical protein [Bordetella sp. FB-8]